MAMPTLVVANSSRPDSEIGSCSVATIRSANSTASLTSWMSSRTITNSSPPKRATVSDARIDVGEPLRDLNEQLVAHDVAEAVVHQLEAVEVEEQDGDVAAGAFGTRHECESRSTSSSRFGSRVRSSCSAWCASASSARLRSVMSRTWTK